MKYWQFLSCVLGKKINIQIAFTSLIDLYKFNVIRKLAITFHKGVTGRNFFLIICY